MLKNIKIYPCLAVAILKKIGYKRVKSHVFEGMRHEVFNEIKKEKVWKYMLEKIDRYI